MSNAQNIYIDTETIIINLLREDMKTYLPIRRLQKLISYIYQQLAEQDYLKGYNVIFNVNFDSIERTVLYNSNIFELVGDTIYLKTSIEQLSSKCTSDDHIREIIRDFCKAA